MQTEIYLDANATTPVLPIAAARARYAMGTLFGNPSSTHYTGLRAKDMMAKVRASASRLLGTADGRLLFVSGATEAIQTALLSALCAIRERRQLGLPVGRLLLYGATEHKAVPESLAHWNKLLGLNLELCALPVRPDGRHDLKALQAALPEAALLCTMAANNETGVVSDLNAIEALLRQAGSEVFWLVDCVQALGKLALNLSATRIDYAAFSGHKLYAPKGIGMLYLRSAAPFTALMAGGGQEGGLRSGTENMAGVAALGAVLEALEDGHTFRGTAELAVFRDRLAQSLRDALPGIVFNAPFENSLPTTLNFSVPGFSSKELLDLFDASGIRVSSGSACSAAKAAPSFVLEAMGVPAWQAESAIRMSFGPAADEHFISSACERIHGCGIALRAGRLTPSELGATVTDGVLQFASNASSSWLLMDASARSCVVIDPLPELVPRLLGAIRRLDYRLAAVLATSSAGSLAPVHRSLAQQFTSLAGGATPSCDESGWPISCATATLADGSAVGVLPLGRHALARLVQPDGHVYLLGQCPAGHMAAEAVQFAFCAGAVIHDRDATGKPDSQATGVAALPMPRLSAVMHDGAVLCPSFDPDGLVATTLHAERPSSAEKTESDLHLCAQTIDAFLLGHTDALLVDVREPFEHLAGPAASWSGRASVHVPMSRLASQLGAWLRDKPRPLVFICRSGNRSARAAACLRRLGYHQAWHLAGGLALAGGDPS